MGGCYVETSAPLPPTTNVDITLHVGDIQIAARGQAQRVLGDVRGVTSVGDHDRLTERPFRHYRRLHAGCLAACVESHER